MCRVCWIIGFVGDWYRDGSGMLILVDFCLGSGKRGVVFFIGRERGISLIVLLRKEGRSGGFDWESKRNRFSY